MKLKQFWILPITCVGLPESDMSFSETTFRFTNCQKRWFRYNHYGVLSECEVVVAVKNCEKLMIVRRLCNS